MSTAAQQLLCACTSGDVRLHNSRCACVFLLLYDKRDHLPNVGKMISYFFSLYFILSTNRGDCSIREL